MGAGRCAVRVVNVALLSQELGIETARGPRNRVWRSPEVLAALDAFAERAGRRR
ncbi:MULTISPECIES: hypothetical protein [Mycolicibacterium]|uniref:Fic family protein n=1 Tax=Mycolicibacterium gilvum TaxID=1804 RepID=A0A378SHV7_9MYCO|nr:MULTISPECIES: hypothetical protein [Mycolicibacterium]MBV5246791.1 hypothetical protein [Mycolicibacterium sp. PAM1]MCV7055941.1 hypothetical protein [Mycolicibacterium gilvum]STZ40957.1 Fic family protein [Mycolicibacterium gilvum]